MRLGMQPYGNQVAKIVSLEKGYLFDHDFYPGSTPVELGLEWLVARDKVGYRGCDAIRSRLENGVATKLAGFEIEDPQFQVSGRCALVKEGQGVGEATAGAYSFTLGKNLGRGWVGVEQVRAGDALEIVSATGASRIRIASSYRWYDPSGLRLHG